MSGALSVGLPRIFSENCSRGFSIPNAFVPSIFLNALKISRVWFSNPEIYYNKRCAVGNIESNHESSKKSGSGQHITSVIIYTQRFCSQQNFVSRSSSKCIHTYLIDDPKKESWHTCSRRGGVSILDHLPQPSPTHYELCLYNSTLIPSTYIPNWSRQ